MQGMIWRHLAPNCFSALLVFATLRFGQVILLGSVLSFSGGWGAQPPVAELGIHGRTGAGNSCSTRRISRWRRV